MQELFWETHTRKEDKAQWVNQHFEQTYVIYKLKPFSIIPNILIPFSKSNLFHLIVIVGQFHLVIVGG